MDNTPVDGLLSSKSRIFLVPQHVSALDLLWGGELQLPRTPAAFSTRLFSRTTIETFKSWVTVLVSLLLWFNPPALFWRYYCWESLTNFDKSSIFNVWLSSEYFSLLVLFVTEKGPRKMPHSQIYCQFCIILLYFVLSFWHMNHDLL